MTDKYFTFRDLNINDIDAILELQDVIFDTIADPDLLRKNTREMFELCVSEPNWTIGAYAPEQPDLLAGIAIMFVPGDTPENLSGHLVRHKVADSVNAKLIMIRKEYRGKGFQKTALKMIEERASFLGFDGICATVSPDNIYSRNSLKACGYEYDHTERKYGGLLRDVYFRKL